MCVSTGKAGVLKAWTITTAAVFRPVAPCRVVSRHVTCRHVNRPVRHSFVLFVQTNRVLGVRKKPIIT